jgi:hypothetical protein
MEVHYTADQPQARRRYRLTLDFMASSLPAPARLLDLGPRNPLTEIMEARGYTVFNTDADLDLEPEVVRRHDVDAVTAFEILEHLVAPFNVLRQIVAPRLFATVPLRLWFASAYRHPSDPWDRHFHEFEDWQFDWLLDKAGWRIERNEQWTNPSGVIGVRPILRRFTPRYYAVEASNSRQSG